MTTSLDFKLEMQNTGPRELTTPGRADLKIWVLSAGPSVIWAEVTSYRMSDSGVTSEVIRVLKSVVKLISPFWGIYLE